MRMKKEARQSLQAGRAKRPAVRADIDIVTENLEHDWNAGCMWLGVAVVLCFGPMLVWAALAW